MGGDCLRSDERIWFARGRSRCRARDAVDMGLSNLGNGESLTRFRKRERCTWGKVKVKSLSRVQLFATPCTTYQAPLAMRFSRQ